MKKTSSIQIQVLLTLFVAMFSSCWSTRTTSEFDSSVVGKYEQPCPDVPEYIDPRDSTVYRTIQIGEQCWMKENLRWLPSVSHPRDNSQINPHYYVSRYYSNDVDEAKASVFYNLYGGLYNWPAALDACPPGWQLPSEDDFFNLTGYLINNYEEITNENVDSHLMSARKVRSSLGGVYNTRFHPRWDRRVKQHGVDSFGFSFLPGGLLTNRFFGCVGHMGILWSNSEFDSNVAMAFSIPFIEDCQLCRGKKSFAYSVRCIKE